MKRHVEVVQYHKDWPQKFQDEAAALKAVFGAQVVGVYHFGSTAIPGVSAKPIIDILLTVRDLTSADALTPRLVMMGYVAVGEYGISGRRFFYKGSFDQRTHHLHIYQYDNPQILRHIAFRDYMRTHPSSARQYSMLKETLAHKFSDDMDHYIEGKNEFVQQHEREAVRWWDECGYEMESDS